MLTTTTKYDSIVSGGHYKTEWAVAVEVDRNDGYITLGGETFQGNNLDEVDVDWGIFGDAAAIGCVQARQMTVRLRLPKTATVKNTSNGVNLYGQVYSEAAPYVSKWLHMGTFFISRRHRSGEILELTCYDPILKSQGDFFSDGADIGEWPQSMKAVAQTIATRIGCTLSIPTSLPDYQMAAPIGMSMRDVLASMAAAWGGNWTCRGAGEITGSPNINGTPVLTLLPITGNLGSITLGQAATKMSAIGEPTLFTGVRMFWSDTDCFESGNCNSKPLECYCEWATQAMADNVRATLVGKHFQAFEAVNAWLHPAVEPGDAVTINGITSQIVNMKGRLLAGCALDISFPGGEVEEDEYPYEGPVSKAMAKKVSTGKPYYGATISREKGLTIERSDGKSEAIMNSDVFSMRAKNASGQMVDCIYFDAIAQLYRITGQVEIDGSLVTENLYAEEGDIVSLTVDRLLTSQRVKKYLTNDLTPDNHISIQENRAKWISATVKKDNNGDPIVIQHKNKDGSLLYWTENPASATVVDGHYEVDGHRVTTTTTDTGWPVYVYDYEEAQAMQITFYDGKPAVVLGAGATNANGTGLIMKTDSGILISYTTPSGKQEYIKMDDSGRIICKDALTAVDLSHLDDDETFTMTYNGQAVTYGLAKTDGGYTLTKPNGEGVVTIAT